MIFEFKEKITKHILVYDDARHIKRQAERIRHGVDYLNDKFGLSIEQYESVIDEDSKKDIDDLIKELFAFADDPHDLFFNATDGPANIGILLSSAILAAGGQVVVYDNLDNTYNLLYKNNMRNLAVLHNMGVHDYCNMMGMRVLDYRRKSEIKRNKKEVVRLFRSYGVFSRVREALGAGERKFPYGDRGILKALETIGAIDRDRTIIDRNYLFGGMFEEYIYFLAKRLDVDDIMLGVVVAMDKVEESEVRNEFDILMMKENHPLIIECKHKRNLNGDNIIYKYDAIHNDFGPDSKVMIVNISDKQKIRYKNSKISTSFSRGNINRAFLSNIDVYHETRINERKFLKRMQRFFGVRLKPKLPDSAQ
jgi:hypothetical protein